MCQNKAGLLVHNKLDQGTWLCWTLLGPYWTKLDQFGPFCLCRPIYSNPSIWSCLLEPVYLVLSIWTCFFGTRQIGPIYLDPSILLGLIYFDMSIWDINICTHLFGIVCLDLSLWTHLFRPIYLDLSAWNSLFKSGVSIWNSANHNKFHSRHKLTLRRQFSKNCPLAGVRVFVGCPLPMRFFLGLSLALRLHQIPASQWLTPKNSFKDFRGYFFLKIFQRKIVSKILEEISLEDFGGKSF